MAGSAYGEGEVIFREGDTGDCMYSITKGKVAVTVKGAAVASLHEGDVFGERALMAGEERNATVQCASKRCELAVLRKKAFMKMMKTTPEAQQGMMTLRKQRTFKEMTGALR